MSTIIKTRFHTFGQALACKAEKSESYEPSKVTVMKLTEIFNGQFKQLGGARGLQKEITGELDGLRSPRLKQLAIEFLKQLPVPGVQMAEARTPTPIARPDSQPNKQAAVAQWPADTRPVPTPDYDQPETGLSIASPNDVSSPVTHTTPDADSNVDPEPDYDDEAPSLVTKSTSKPKSEREADPETVRSILKPSLPAPDYEPVPDYERAEVVPDYQRVEYGSLATVVGGKAQSYRVQTRREDGGSPPRRVAQPDGGSTGVVKDALVLKQFAEEGSATRFSTGEMTRFWEAALSVPEISAVIPRETLDDVIRLLEHPGAWSNYQLGVSAVRPEEPVPPSATVLAAVIKASGLSFD